MPVAPTRVETSHGLSTALRSRRGEMGTIAAKLAIEAINRNIERQPLGRNLRVAGRKSYTFCHRVARASGTMLRLSRGARTPPLGAEGRERGTGAQGLSGWVHANCGVGGKRPAQDRAC